MSDKRGLRTGSNHTRRPVAILAALIVAAVAGPTSAEERLETLDHQLLRHAPGVFRYLKEHGYKSVGVLKFRVKIGDQPLSDHVGPLNLSLADRLETALILADDFREPIGIIHGAGPLWPPRSRGPTT